MDIIFLAFANNSAEPLASLQEEDQKIYSLLSPRAQQQHYFLHRDSFATVSSVAENIAKWRNDLRVFLYSGHAGRDELVLQGGSGSAEGIAQLLGQCPNINLVFLNGCSTKGQVERLLEAGVPNVIATSAPINDKIATTFSIAFFRALEQQNSLGEAFDLAKAEIALTRPDINIPSRGSLGLAQEAPEEILWGLYSKDDGAAKLDYKLPAASNKEIIIRGATDRYNASSTPVNETLTQVLFDVLAKHSKKLKMLKLLAEDEDEDEDIDIREVRGYIMDSLPAPIAEQVRKLFAATPETQSSGYDKIGLERLKQLVRTYNIMMELLTFSMLGQLWDVRFEKQDAQVSEDCAKEIIKFLKLTPQERKTYYLMPLIRHIRIYFDKHDAVYFIEELKELRKALDEDASFATALDFMEAMKKELYAEGSRVAAEEIESFCVQSEEHLSNMFRLLGFTAKYKLTTIKNIDLIKKRNTQPQYKHFIVNLDTVTRGYLDQDVTFDVFTDTKSVLFLRSKKNVETYLNLSPFVIDENAYTGDDKTKLYFFSNLDSSGKKFNYQFAYVHDDMLEVSEHNYPELAADWDEFCQVVLNKKLSEL